MSKLNYSRKNKGSRGGTQTDLLLGCAEQFLGGGEAL